MPIAYYHRRCWSVVFCSLKIIEKPFHGYLVRLVLMKFYLPIHMTSGGVKKLAEKAVDRAAEKSQLVAKLADMLLATEGDVVALYETGAPDLRAAATEVIRLNKQ
jgi:hypothetical protein